MTTLPHAEHAIRRKAYSPHYATSNLALFQPDLQDYSVKLLDVSDQRACRKNSALTPSDVQVIERISGKTSVDCLDLFRHLMVDVIACTVFGSRSGSLDNWATNIRDPLSVAVYDFPKRGIMVGHLLGWLHTLELSLTPFQRSVIPTWAWNLICRIPNARWRELCNSDGIMAEVRLSLSVQPVSQLSFCSCSLLVVVSTNSVPTFRPARSAVMSTARGCP